MPHFPMSTRAQSSQDASSDVQHISIKVKNRRKRYLDLHPEYFTADLELAGPLALSLLQAQHLVSAVLGHGFQRVGLTAES
jgi:hypothetical protein